jgi:integrase
MRRLQGLHKLTALAVKKATKPGTYEDGGGLRLIISKAGNKRWIIRIAIRGKRRDIGLGGYPAVALEEARERAGEMRKAVRAGLDPLHERRLERSKEVTFQRAFESFFDVKQKSLSNAKHLKQWPSTMQTYVFPKIGSRPVADVTSAEVVEVLRLIWWEKPETARRVLQRMRAVFDAAIVLGQREKANPCSGLTSVLGTNHFDNEHHRALPYAEVPDFIVMLRGSAAEPVTKLAFEWLVLTATRSGETRGAARSEIDEAQALWVIPKERMKSREAHVVPLSPRCLQIIAAARALNQDNDLLFPGSRTRKALSDMTFTKLLRDIGLADRATAHGFRSSFRDWATEVAKAREVVAEAALAHGVTDKTEAAYRRASYLDERRELMQLWATFCASARSIRNS